MSTQLESDIDPIDRIRDIPRITEALRLGVRTALLDHRRAGNPIAVWQDGQVVWIAPGDIFVDSEPELGDSDAEGGTRVASGDERPGRSPLPVIEKAMMGKPIPALRRGELAQIELSEDRDKRDRSLGR